MCFILYFIGKICEKIDIGYFGGDENIFLLAQVIEIFKAKHQFRNGFENCSLQQYFETYSYWEQTYTKYILALNINEVPANILENSRCGWMLSAQNVLVYYFVVKL